MESTTDRWTEIRETHHENPFIYQIMGGAALVALGILLGAAIFAQDEGYATNLYTEILSIGVTVFILNTLAERREKSQRIRDLKVQLVRDAGSQSNEATKRAIHELRQRGWLEGEDGLLRGANLAGANLHNVRLRRANLENIDLMQANLKGAILIQANLQRANCMFANLQNSNLWLAKLGGAHLHGANLIGVDFDNNEAKFDEDTILPNGSHWTPETDMTRFTDPKHPNFWRSDWVAHTDPQ